MLFFILGIFLYGDVMYEMVVTTEGLLGMVSEEITMRVFIKGDCSRMEMTTKNAMAAERDSEENIIIITRLDKGVIWTLDDDNEEYSENKIDELTDSVAIEEEGLKIEISEIKVEKTGNKKMILESECEEVVISMDIENDEDAMHLSQTMWVTQDVPGYEELDNFTKKMAEFNISPFSLNASGEDEFTEQFREKINSVEGFPLEVSLLMTMDLLSFSMKSLITNIDSIPIHNKVFEIPVGYSLREEKVEEHGAEDQSDGDRQENQGD